MAEVSNPSSPSRSDHGPTEPTAVRHSRGREITEVGRLWTEKRLTLLHGRPGMGKSVLLRSGVIPLLRGEGRLLPPVGRVARHVAFPRAAFPPQNPFVFPLLVSWAPDESPERFFEMSVEQFLSRYPVSGAAGSVHLCIEQAELLFQRFTGREEQRDLLLKDLAGTLSERSDLRLLLVLRSSRLQEALAFAARLSVPKDSVGVFEVRSPDRPPETAQAGRVARGPDASTRLEEAAEAFWSESFPLARVHAERALQECHPQDLELRALTECLLGDIAFARGAFQDAIGKYAAAVEVFEVLRRKQLVGYLLCAIGTLHGKTDPASPSKALQNLYAAAARLPDDVHVRKALEEALHRPG